MSNKPSIPPVPKGDPERVKFDKSVKENLESMTGRRDKDLKLTPLPSTATLTDVIASINEIINALQ